MLMAEFLFMTAAQGVTWITLKTFVITGDFSDFLLSLLFTAAPAAVAGVLLWKYSDRIARVADQAEPAELSRTITTDDLLGAGIFLVGLYAILFGLVDAIGVEAADWLARSIPDPDSDYQANALIRNWTRRVGYLLQIVLGAGVIYYRHRLVVLSHRFRKAGLDAA
jgi:hypothetical protein